MKKSRISKLIALLLVFSIMSCMLAGFASAQTQDDIYYGVVNTDCTRIRSDPVNGAVLGLAYVNYVIYIDDTMYGSDGYIWFHGDVYTSLFNGTDTGVTGWIRSDLVDLYRV